MQSNTYNHSNAGLFSFLIKSSVENESLSLTTNMLIGLEIMIIVSNYINKSMHQIIITVSTDNTKM